MNQFIPNTSKQYKQYTFKFKEGGRRRKTLNKFILTPR